MSSSLEHIDACLPVTTLKALVFGDTRLVLLGQGPYARLVEEESGIVLAYSRIFQRNNIHGFAILHRSELESGRDYVQLLAWGDRSLRLIDLSCLRDGPFRDPVASLVPASAEFYASDWVLAGCAPSTTQESSTAYLVTAHNAVLGLTVVNEPSSKYEKAIHLQQLVVGVKSILYSADIIPISPTNLLVAAGTVFGEIIVWSCFIRGNEGSVADVVSSIHHFFTGHEGSIFDVQISPEIANLHGDLPGRLLASCSDDRTIRIWDISGCEHATPDAPSAYSTDGFELRCTGFGHVKDGMQLKSESCVANAFGHGARIWGIHFLATQPSKGKICLVSRGEDAHCLVWDLSWESSLSQKSEFKLANTCSLRNHNGKHVWSLGLSTIGTETTVYTGGADGAVRTFKLIQESGKVVCPNRTTHITGATASEGTGDTVDVSLKAFAFVSPECFLATTTLGEIQIGWVKSPNSFDRRIALETVSFEEDLRGYAIIAGFPHQGVALIGNQQGIIRFYDHGARSLTQVTEVGQRPVGLHALDYHPETSDSPAMVSFLTTYVNPDTADLFHIYLGPAESRVEKVTLHVPQGFDIACASLINNNDYLALGSRYGSLVVYNMGKTGPLQSLLKVNRLHSKDGVTRIIPFSSFSPAASTQSPYFLTCGRDGNYRVNTLEVSEGSEESVSVRTVHSPTTLSFKIEGAYINTSSQELMLYGFQGMDFLVWNESTQFETARIHCGGAHRRWAFHPSTERPSEALLIWAQAGFKAFHINSHMTRSIRAGAHGREIKTLGTFQPAGGKSPLFVTGSEDTTLRIFTSKSPRTEGPWGALECIRVLTTHDSAPQHIGWSKNGKFMFTSSAMEDFYVWKISSIPVFGLTAALTGWCPKSQPKSELRVTCFDILDVEDAEAEAGFLLCLTYSNSTIKVFHLSCADEDGHFTLLASGTYTSNCLTQTRFLRTPFSLCLITTSTDGHFTLWDLTPILEPFYTLTPTLRLTRSLRALSIIEDNIACENRHQIHSNSIKSIDLVQLSDTATLIIAGGDDNAVTLSLLHTDLKDVEMSGRAATINIPDAHTASVNAVKVIEPSIFKDDGNMRLSFVSSGNDHRVKIWQVVIDMTDRPTLDGIQVQKVLDRYSPVADISSLDVVRDEGEIKLLVCGVGMEYFNVDLQ
ncbi:WD40-repeat-containing domain protein [Aspergillus cavernicola]|uniref:WD40-repeat-containing domain protein n=1 Tax=Aspergillus cavernicola TaxID=176166 RepID=A0ABR4I4N6_9EURO